MKQFKGKVVAITGAATGMGAAYAREFLKQGARVAICDIQADKLESTRQDLLNRYDTPIIYSEVVDVSDRKAVFDFADHVKQELGNCHVIINNAGIEGAVRPVYNMEISDIEHVMNVNFWSVVYGTKAFLPQLVANNEGAVVNVSSIFGLVGTPNSGDYCASKFAVRGFTESLMTEFEDSPISIHCVHPGGIATEIVKKDDGKAFAKKYLTTSPDAIARYVRQSIVVGRAKIVYGNGSFKTWLASNLVPQNILNKIIWNELKDLGDKEEYKAFTGR